MFLKTITFKSMRDPSVSANISKMVIATGNLLAYIEFIISNAKKQKKKLQFTLQAICKTSWQSMGSKEKKQLPLSDKGSYSSLDEWPEAYDYEFDYDSTETSSNESDETDGIRVIIAQQMMSPIKIF